MLIALRIEHLAIIDKLELEFLSGFTVFTGETGAGKSILVDALTLALGGRGSTDLIRSGGESAEVEALFDLSNIPGASHFLAEAGLLPGGSHELVLRRRLSRSGRSRVWINGRLESTARLFELGRQLVDIYGQHEYQTLLQPEHHREFLDVFAELKDQLAAYEAAYFDWRRLKEKLAALDLNEKEKRERIDLLRYRLQEITAVQLEADEEERLSAEREILRHAEELQRAAGEAVFYLYDAEDSAAAGLRRTAARLKDAAVHDPSFLGPAEQLEQAAALVEEASLDLRRRRDAIEADPGRLSWVEDRLHEIRRLTRKYGGSVADILAVAEAARKELESLENMEERREELSHKVEAAFARAHELAAALTAARKKASLHLARAVEEELKSLGMNRCRFEARITPLPEGLNPAGADMVAFFLSPNPGEELKPLERIASGGELSRIMLALRVLLRPGGEGQTLVFDEVDAGIGGAVAEAVGLRMKALADKHHVFCVTHLPQIAALADHHFLVSKYQERDRTWVRVAPLSEEERIEELARMLGGREITAATRMHAREMLEAGKRAGKGREQRAKAGLKSPRSPSSAR